MYFGPMLPFNRSMVNLKCSKSIFHRSYTKLVQAESCIKCWVIMTFAIHILNGYLGPFACVVYFDQRLGAAHS